MKGENLGIEKTFIVKVSLNNHITYLNKTDLKDCLRLKPDH